MITCDFAHSLCLFSHLTFCFVSDDDEKDESEGDDGYNAKKRKTTRKKRGYGTLNYDQHKNELNRVTNGGKSANKRKEIYELVVKFSKLSNKTGAETGAVDCKSYSWVNKLRGSVKKYENCINVCWKDHGKLDGWLSMENGETLASSEYKCKCPWSKNED